MGSVPPLPVRLVCLGFDKTCSLKPPPGRHLFGLIVEQILLDGFVSSSEPVLVSQSRTMDADLPQFCDLGTFSLGYIKGMARVSSLMAVLRKVFKDDVDLQSPSRVVQVSLHNLCASC